MLRMNLPLLSVETRAARCPSEVFALTSASAMGRPNASATLPSTRWRAGLDSSAVLEPTNVPQSNSGAATNMKRAMVLENPDRNEILASCDGYSGCIPVAAQGGIIFAYDSRKMHTTTIRSRRVAPRAGRTLYHYACRSDE